jgi:hypothetical protein
MVNESCFDLGPTAGAGMRESTSVIDIQHRLVRVEWTSIHSSLIPSAEAGKKEHPGSGKEI